MKPPTPIFDALAELSRCLKEGAASQEPNPTGDATLEVSAAQWRAILAEVRSSVGALYPCPVSGDRVAGIALRCVGETKKAGPHP